MSATRPNAWWLVGITALGLAALAIWQLCDTDEVPSHSGHASKATSQPIRGITTPPVREAVQSTDPAEGQPAANIQTGLSIRISGTVISAVTNQPIAGVSIVGATARGVVRTNESGQYIVVAALTKRSSGVPGCLLKIQHEGYITGFVAIAKDQLGPDNHAEYQNVSLWPTARGATLRGQVVDEGGAAIPLASVSLERLVPGAVRNLPQAAWTTTRTTVTGHFEFSNLAPTTHAVRITHKDFLPYSRAELRIETQSRNELGTTTLRRLRPATLAGTMTRLGRGQAGVKIRLRVASGKEMQTVSDAQGHYRYEGLQAGRRFIFITWQQVDLHHRVHLRAGRTTRHDVSLPAGDHFVGGVIVCAGKPAPGIGVECASSDPAYDRFAWQCVADKNGRFRLDNLPRGTVTLNLIRENPWTLEEVKSVALDRDDYRFEFPVALPNITVHGTVKTPAGVPIEGALVIAGPRDVVRMRTGVDGRYRLPVQVARDSSVRLLVTRNGYLQSRTYLMRSAVNKQRVEQRDFVLYPIQGGGEVAGQVLDASSQPIAGVRCVISAKPKVGQPLTWSTTTDSEGRFLQRGVLPGPVRVILSNENYLRKMQRGTVAANGRWDLKIQLEERKRLLRAVLVEDAAGLPVHGASVYVWWPNGAYVTHGTTDQGHCELENLPDKPVHVSVKAAGHARQRITHDFSQVVTVPTIRLRRGKHDCHGTVVDGEGAPRVSVEVHLKEIRANGLVVETHTYTDKDGRFAARHLPRGSYRVSAYGNGKQVKTTHTIPGEPLRLVIQ